jgi:hypothetical protein
MSPNCCNSYGVTSVSDVVVSYACSCTRVLAGRTFSSHHCYLWCICVKGKPVCCFICKPESSTNALNAFEDVRCLYKYFGPEDLRNCILCTCYDQE